MTCERYQEQLLDHLYGLLEANEESALTQHLTGCDGCRSALNIAKHQQGLLATAAKLDFATVRFVPPPVERRVLPLRHRMSVARWAAAAAILIATGLALAGGFYYVGVGHLDDAIAQAEIQKNNAMAEVRQLNETVAAKQKPITELEQQRERLQKEQHEQLVAIERNWKQKTIYINVTGPDNIEAGAPNNFIIQARNLEEKPVDAKIDARLVDAQQKPVFADKPLALMPRSVGEYQITLPRDLELKPGADVYLEIAATGADGTETQLKEKLQLARPVYITHLTTDKPLYQPGESVYFRSLTLERFSLRPPQEKLRLRYSILNPNGEEVYQLAGGMELVDPKTQKPILGPDGKPIAGLGCGNFPIPGGLRGGEYTLQVAEANNRFPLEKRKFLINQYEKPRLKKELEFTRKSYGPGDEVVAACQASPAEGGTAIAKKPVTASVQLDGTQVAELKLETDAAGAVRVRFNLPKEIQRGEGSLAVTFTDGGNVESIVKPIPIVVNRLAVQLFPEGGDLVAGVANRVYFWAKTPTDKPAEFTGHLIDDEGKVVANLQTLTDDEQPGVNQGMGVFEFTPVLGKKYRLVPDRPAGIVLESDVPKVKDIGVVLNIPTGVINAKDPIKVRLLSTKPDANMLVGLYCRGRLIEHRTVLVKNGSPTELEFKPDSTIGGVYRVTVFEESKSDKGKDYKPLAERLIFRSAAERVNIALRTQRQRFIPGEKVLMSLEATREDGTPAPAIVMVGVVDKNLLTLADEKTARSMPTHFLLTSEVRKPEDLEHVDVLLTNHPKATLALDLMLGTQGWRRFAEQNPQEFKQREKDDAQRMLARMGHNPVMATNSPERFLALGALMANEVQRVRNEYQPKLNAIVDKRNDAQIEVDKLLRDPSWRKRESTAQQTAIVAIRNHQNVTKELVDYQKQWLLGGLVAAAVLLPLFGILCVLIAARRRGWKATGLYAVAALAAAGFIVALVQLEKTSWNIAIDNAIQIVELTEGKNDKQGLNPPAVAATPVHGMIKPKLPLADPPANARLMDPQAAANPQAVKLDGKPTQLPGPALPGMAGQAVPTIPGAPGMPGAFGTPGKPFGGGGGGPAMPGMPGRPGVVNNAKGEEPPLPPFVVREYAHRRAATNTGVRSDFTETVYWHPVLVLPNGKGQVEFDLPDSVTTFQITAAAHTLDGRLGSATSTVEAQLPFSVAPKLPIEVTATDRLDIPLSVANNTDDRQQVKLSVESVHGFAVENSLQHELTLEAGKRDRRLFRLRPTLLEGDGILQFNGKSEPFFSDSVRRSIKIVPDGFPVTASKSDLLEKAAVAEVTLPETWIKGTLKLSVNAYPSSLADLQKGLEGLLREPHGCFEQTSTSNYPNVLILDYLKESEQVNPKVTARARELLEQGYAKLTSFECQNPDANKREGYEWFGGAVPPHEALTAYGLMQFSDMSKVHPVNQAMVDRTRGYLLARRDGQGGFQRNPKAIDHFGRAPLDVTNAYVVWALTESGKDDDVSNELNTLLTQAKTANDPYFLSLVAASLLNRSRSADALPLLQKLAKTQKPDGHFDGEKTSITGSGGRDLQIETTALALLAWLKSNHPDFYPNIKTGISWLGQQRGGSGTFGSTQSTILALKALIAYTKANRKTADAGEISLFIDNKEAGRLAFAAGAQDTLSLELPNAEQQLKPGKNSIRVHVTGNNVFPYTLSWSYQTVKPASADNCPVKLTTKLDRATTNEEETVRLTATLENTSGKGQGMAVAIIGIPAGLSLPEDLKQLKEYARLTDNDTKPGKISAFEVRGRELILYWRDLAPDAKIDVNVDLIARIPGQFRGPASRAYLYYNADAKSWTEPLTVDVTAK